MKLLVPVDGSASSERALEFAVEMAEAFGATLDVVHFTDVETDATETVLADARAQLADAGVDASATVVTGEDLSLRTEQKVGDAILARIDDGGHDHVVMGHHGAGTVERAILGSATDTVLEDGRVPVTVVP